MRQASIELCGPDTPFLEALRAVLAFMPGVSLEPAETLDMFVCLLDPGATDECRLAEGPVDMGRLIGAYGRCALGLLERVHAALPRLEAGRGKRLCFVTSLSSSVNLARDTDGDSGSIVLAAANMAIRMLFNSLRPQGYTFRVYAARDYDPAEAPYAAAYMLRDRSDEPGSPTHSDENRLVMRNLWEQEIPW